MTRYRNRGVLQTIFLAVLLGGSTQRALSADDSIVSDLDYDYREFVYWLKRASDEKKIPGAALAIVSR